MVRYGANLPYFPIFLNSSDKILEVVLFRLNKCILLTGNIYGKLASSADPDQTAPEVQSDLGQHCLPKIFRVEMVNSRPSLIYL